MDVRGASAVEPVEKMREVDADFEFTDEQRLLRDQVSRFLDDNVPPGAARPVLDEGIISFDRNLQTANAELGWMGCIIPELYGGAVMICGDLCVIAEELGRSLAPTPPASSVYLATEAIWISGIEDQKQSFLP